MGQSMDYNSQIQPIFDNSCMPCHSGNTPSGGLNLTSYANVMQGSDDGVVIIPFDYENSILWQKVSSGDMPNNYANNTLGIPDLTEEEVQLIGDWILDLGCEVVDCADEYECILGECVCINDSDGDEICDENELNACELIPDPGPCLAAIQIFYFNQNTSQCEETWWGGCDGIVPFWTLEECENSCENNTSIQEVLKEKNLIKVFDLLGRETSLHSKENILIYIYDDGTIEKVEYLK